MTTTIKINEHEYRIGKINAIQQFHVSRRLAPLLGAMGVSLNRLAAGAKGTIEDFAPVIAPATEMLAKMTDEESNYIIFTCLGCVQRVIDGRTQSVAAALSSGSPALMFEDMDMLVLIQLVVSVLKENLGPFLQGLVAEA